MMFVEDIRPDAHRSSDELVRSHVESRDGTASG